MKIKTWLYSSVLLLTSDVFYTCKRNYDAVPVQKIPVGGFFKIKDLRALYQSQNVPVKFNQDASIFLLVTMDETSGNIYKQVYAKDSAGQAICVKLLASGGLYQGDLIRLNLKGATLDASNNQLQIDSVDTDLEVVKISTGNIILPELIPLQQVDTGFESRLIKLDHIEFLDAAKGKTFGDPIHRKNTSYPIHACGADNYLTVYTSPYCNFASQRIPAANGSIVAIVQRYNNGVELILRSWQEIELLQTPCGDLMDTLFEDFDETTSGQNLNLGAWGNITQSGMGLWQSYPKNASAHTNLYAHCSSFFSTAIADTVWLITPKLKVAPVRKLSFQTATAYWKADQLSVLISQDYDGQHPGIAHWISVDGDFILAGSGTGNNNFISSGVADIGGYLHQGQEFFIGFRYCGSKAGLQTSDFMIDNIRIGY